jgi:hypothetical protein
MATEQRVRGIKSGVVGMCTARLIYLSEECFDDEKAESFQVNNTTNSHFVFQ